MYVNIIHIIHVDLLLVYSRPIYIYYLTCTDPVRQWNSEAPRDSGEVRVPAQERSNWLL